MSISSVLGSFRGRLIHLGRSSILTPRPLFDPHCASVVGWVIQDHRYLEPYVTDPAFSFQGSPWHGTVLWVDTPVGIIALSIFHRLCHPIILGIRRLPVWFSRDVVYIQQEIFEVYFLDSFTAFTMAAFGSSADTLNCLPPIPTT